MKYLALLVMLFVLAACGHPTTEGLVFHTADPNVTVGFRWAEPPVVPAEEVGEVLPVPPLEPPCEMIVKGNINTRTGEKIAHSPGQANYDNVKIDEAAGEMWFCSLEEAIAAGWRAALR